MKFMTLLLILFLSAPFVFSEKVSVLPDIMKPQFIAVDNDQLYISENTTVYIYSLKDYKLKCKFGKQGEGPEEFNTYAIVIPQQDSLIINSRGKVSYFSKDGKYIKEIKNKAGVIGGGGFLPLGKNFVGQGFTREENKIYSTFNIYDSQLLKIKEISRNDLDRRPQKINPLDAKLYRLDFKVYGEYIYIGNDKNGIIKVYDKEGKNLMSITYKYNKIEVTEKDKNEMLEEYRINPDTKAAYERLKDRIEFPGYYPLFYDFFPIGKKTYVLTYKRDKNSAEFIVFNNEGKFIKKSLAPFYQTNMHLTYPHTIVGDKLYQLVENEDEEEWELHISTIK